MANDALRRWRWRMIPATALMLAAGLAAIVNAADQEALLGPELWPPSKGSPVALGLTGAAPKPAAQVPPALVPLRTAADAPKLEAAPSTPLTADDQPRARSQQLEDVAAEADRHTRHGYELAGRNAYYAARTEFSTALRLLAEGLDAEFKVDHHRTALTAALTAMKEAEDFLPQGSQLEAPRDVDQIIGAHVTRVLKERQEGLTSLVALKCYLSYAQEQLAAAIGHEVAGSVALHGLGKLHVAAANNKAMHLCAAEAKAVVFYQAALLVSPQNFMAANDLGVLLARCGKPDDARKVLEYSVTVHGQAPSWDNLSVVYRQLGLASLAAHAAQQAVQVRQAELAQRQRLQQPAQDKVRWLGPGTFAQTSRNTPGSPEAFQPAASQTATAPAAQPTVGWSPWSPQNTRR